MADQGQKTEKPTPQRLKKAREEGRFPTSREFLFGFQFLVFVTLLAAQGPQYWARQQAVLVRALRIGRPEDMGIPAVADIFRGYAWDLLMPLLIGGSILFAGALGVQLGVTGFGIAGSRLKPDFNRLSPMSRLKELPAQNLTSLVQALILLPLLFAAVWAVAADQASLFMKIPFMPLRHGAALVSSSLLDLLWKVTGLFVVWGAIDLFRQRRRYMREMRMTKQEIREEYKQSDGNPEIKMRIRRLRRDLLRRKMMSEVPKATAVIVNPTHFAVAIRYNVQDMAAPKVVAKGKNFLALRIRQKALEHQVPVIENPPLARALYKSVDVGQEIPAHLYRAVAEILAYIYRIMNGRRPG